MNVPEERENMSKSLHVVHYLNQFFGGIGGEDKASVGPQIKEGTVGLGGAMQNALKDNGKIVATVICGDNYFAENTEEAVTKILQMMESFRPEIVIAGPAFNAGRYGIACGEVCRAVQNKLGIPTVTGMYDENPGVDLYKREVYIVRTNDSVKNAAEAVSRMISIALRLVNSEKIGRPDEEGYFPRGFIRNERSDKTAAKRAVSMLLSKIKGEPFESEIKLPKFDKVKPAPAVKNLSSAKLALVTDGGLVPRGNPNNIPGLKSTTFASYSIKGISALHPEDFEGNHVGYDTDYVNADPNRLVPLDVMRDMEKEGVIGKLHNTIYSTAGIGTSLDNARKIGQGIAEQLQIDEVNGVILTST